jgi:hypothetical protein
MSTLPMVPAAELLFDYEEAMRLGLDEADALRAEVIRRLEVGRRVPRTHGVWLREAMDKLVAIASTTDGGAEHPDRVRDARSAIVDAAEGHCARALAYALDVDGPLDWSGLLMQVADKTAQLELLRGELDATHAEMAGMLAADTQVSLFSEPDPAQQRRPRLALVPVEDPPLEFAGDALMAAVEAVPGVEQVSVQALASDPTVFLLAARGGDDEAIARAVLRTFPQGTRSTCGTKRVEVDGHAVWLGRPITDSKD